MEKQWKLFYKKLGTIKSFGLKGESVVFGRIGFNHLIRKGRVPRPFKEQTRRFLLLHHAKMILRDPNPKIIERHKSGISFWTFHKTIGDQKTKLVVSQIKGGRKQFLSIMASRYKQQKDPQQGGPS